MANNVFQYKYVKLSVKVIFTKKQSNFFTNHVYDDNAF